MIDETYDRAYRDARDQLSGSIANLMRAFRNPQAKPAGDKPCMRPRLAILAASAALIGAAPPPPEPVSLAGTWVMDSAYEIRADGTRTTNYGEHPRGLMMVDAAGHYSIQIFRPGRLSFASGIKTQGQPDEYRDAVLGSSTHFGHVRVDPAAHQLAFDVEASSFPNWEGKRQLRDYTYANGLLSYAVPASASGNGTIAYSVWRRVQSKQGRP